MKPCKPIFTLLSAVKLAAALLLTGVSLERSLADNLGPNPTNPIPMDQIGAVAKSQYTGGGLAIVATNGGAHLRCAFQRLDGEATPDGLWLKSTVSEQAANDRFRVKAVAVGNQYLSDRGDVSLEDGIVRLSRPGLVEEYSVSMDGVRQDFLVLKKPTGEGGLKVQLDVAGAKVEQTMAGAQLVLENSGRRIAYSRLKVTDAHGKELPSRIEVTSSFAAHTPQSV